MADTSTAPRIDDPRSRYVRKRATRSNYELYSWVFMRVSGVVLIILIFGHLLTNLILPTNGVHALNFAFVAGKWASPFWQIWDLLLLWLAMIHGTNGVRTIINDYAERNGTRFVLKMALYIAFAIVVVLGSLVIFSFNPCPPNSPADLLPSFCNA